MMRTKPPFRADVVGSILRTAPLKEARAKREKGEISAAAAQGGRGPRDREDHQEAGRGRVEARHRRRIPPLVVALRFLRHARRRRNPGARSRHPVSGRADAAANPAHHRQARLLQPPDAGAFQVPQGAHAASCRKCASRARRRCISASSRMPSRPRNTPTAMRSSTIWRRPISRPSAASTTPAAAICSSTTPPGPICVRRPN